MARELMDASTWREEPRVLVSLLNFNEAEATIRCVETLQKLTYPNFDILLVDNCSTDDSVAVLEERFPNNTPKLSGGNYGYAYGHKVSVDRALECNYDLIWILNNDLITFPDSLTALVEEYKRYKLCILGSLTFAAEDSDIISFGGGHETTTGDFKEARYNVFRGKSYSEVKGQCVTRKVAAVEGSSIMIPVDIIRQHGFMALDYFLYGEETDYCMTLWKKGIPSVLVVESKVIHAGGLGLSRPALTVVESYYRMRNWLHLQHRHLGLSRWGILNQEGGIVPMTKFYTKWLFGGKKFRLHNRVVWYENLAIIHAFLGIRGKRVSPEKLSRKAAQTSV